MRAEPGVTIGADECAQLCRAQQLAGEHSPLLIDVRSPSEFASGHIPHSVNIPLEEIRSRLGDVAGRGPVVLVCQSGKRAQLCCGTLAEEGIGSTVLDGGFRGWLVAGHPHVKSARAGWSLERQIRFGAGALILISLTLALLDARWLGFTAFVGGGLVFSGATGKCLLGNLLNLMPWNRSSSVSSQRGRASGTMGV